MRIIFITGQSGSGKNTQSEKIVDYLKEQGKSVLYIDNGKNIRGWNSGSWINTIIRENNRLGKFAPPIFIMALAILESMDKFGAETPDFIVWNGSPRSQEELGDLRQIVQYLGVRAEVVVINVSDKLCRERIIERQARENREETTSEESINKKLSEYNNKTIGALAMLNDHKNYNSLFFQLINVFGENTPDIVFFNMKKKLKI